MTRAKGVVLIMALVFLLVMALLVSAMLLVTQLSHKSAYAGQQQLQLAQLALQQHLQDTRQVAANGQLLGLQLAECPAQYAAWSGSSLHCDMLQLDTERYSVSQQHYAGYSSIMLRQHLTPQEQ
jgi:type II secretory pathway component PulK